MATDKTARIALVGLNTKHADMVGEAFRQFKLNVIHIPLAEAATRLVREKYDGCVVRLTEDGAEQLLKTARSAPSNRHMLLYGISEVMARTHDRRKAERKPYADLSPDEASPL